MVLIEHVKEAAAGLSDGIEEEDFNHSRDDTGPAFRVTAVKLAIHKPEDILQTDCKRGVSQNETEDDDRSHI